MSNKLHLFADEDYKGRLPIIEAINKIKSNWKRVQESIIFVNKNGHLPSRVESEKTYSPGSSIAEIKVELQRIAPNITKKQNNLRDFPMSKKADEWRTELSKLLAIREDLIGKKNKIEYERAREIS